MRRILGTTLLLLGTLTACRDPGAGRPMLHSVAVGGTVVMIADAMPLLPPGCGCGPASVDLVTVRLDPGIPGAQGVWDRGPDGRPPRGGVGNGAGDRCREAGQRVGGGDDRGGARVGHGAQGSALSGIASSKNV